jgi:hypothetical protein
MMYADFLNFFMYLGNFLCRRAFHEAKEGKIWTFIVGVMVIRGILFI